MEEILRIPICLRKSKDELIWHYTENGVFSVTSAYYVGGESLKHLSPSKSAGPSNPHATDIGWKKLWHLKVPPKVKNNLWKFCNNVLPTKELLARRKIQQSSRCPRCDSDLETLKHMVFECQQSREVWNLWGNRIEKLVQASTSSLDLWLKLSDAENLKPSQLEEFATLIGSIWNNRNTFLFEGHS